MYCGTEREGVVPEEVWLYHHHPEDLLESFNIYQAAIAAITSYTVRFTRPRLLTFSISTSGRSRSPRFTPAHLSSLRFTTVYAQRTASGDGIFFKGNRFSATTARLHIMFRVSRTSTTSSPYFRFSALNSSLAYDS